MKPCFSILLPASLALFAGASQPEAPKPVKAPMRDLQWGDLNILHTTDTHGWLGGHLQEPQYSADWGDYVSFAAHLHERSNERGVDLLLVDTGDRVEGNGLYDRSHPQGKYTSLVFGYHHPRLDVVTTGNHELYVAETAWREFDTMVPRFGAAYVASNLDYVGGSDNSQTTGQRTSMAPRFRRFRTRNRGFDIVAFGFLFDFAGNANNTIVQPVESVVREPWFLAATDPSSPPDLFLVAGHVGLRMPEFDAVFRAIRARNPLTPIIFLGGHRHVRDARIFDSRAVAMASGRYFETIGFLAIEGLEPGSGKGKSKRKKPIKADAHIEETAMGQGHLKFHRRYIDNNLFGFYHHTGLNESTFPTDHGLNVSAMITEARQDLKLGHRYGCAPRDLWMTRTPVNADDSIYTWLVRDVLPAVAIPTDPERRHNPRLIIMNTGAIRFDIFKGPFSVDSEYIVSPFKSGFNFLPDVPYDVASKVIGLLNRGGPVMDSVMRNNRLSHTSLMGLPQQYNGAGDMPAASDTRQVVSAPRQKVLGTPETNHKPSSIPLIGGYTTVDDFGDDGDDTVHAPINFYAVPNCIQATANLDSPKSARHEPQDANPKVVDLVYLDFVEPWLLTALKLAGGQQSKADVRRHQKGSFTDAMVGWIKRNWNGKC